MGTDLMELATMAYGPGLSDERMLERLWGVLAAARAPANDPGFVTDESFGDLFDEVVELTPEMVVRKPQ